jgi:hypothetical protein
MNTDEESMSGFVFLVCAHLCSSVAEEAKFS